ncbi:MULTISPECIES: LpqB family beta-propeller domain-containing protein [unclassified Streptomyces]|uniref:LpqB family beta-propeller domain-containing protein n=1 Tax=unclassified Streptomyces TaxID=2593676 RepID=UPI0038140870
MGAERGRGFGKLPRLAVVLGSGALLVSGCASMPSSGDVHGVSASQRADSQVQVYAVPPRPGADPNEIVSGFLEAMTSDDPQFAMARQYLTAKAARDWQPSEVTVLAGGPDPQPNRSSDRGADSNGFTFTVSGKPVAVVDQQHAYQPAKPQDTYSQTIHLVRQSGQDGTGKEWRIDALPEGLLLGQSDFQRIYRSVNTYYFAAGQDRLVADPVYVRQRNDPETQMNLITQTVQSVLNGPTNWLKPVVTSKFPSGTGLKSDTKSLALDDRNALKVPLNERASNAGEAQCKRMAAQLLFTLRDLTTTRIGQVELDRANGSQLCVLSGDQAETYAPDRMSTSPGQYFVDAGGHVARMRAAAASADSSGGTDGSSGTDGSDAAVVTEPVQGPFGKGEQQVRTVAVSRDEKRAAGVSADGKSLFVAPLAAGAELVRTPVTSDDRDAKSGGLSAPSWDGRGDLWVADRNPARPRLLRLAQGTGEPETVDVAGLNGARIEQVRMSADGVRVALLVFEGGRKTLRIGRVERTGDGDKSVVSVVELRAGAPQMEDVTAVSWAGRSRLVVVGKEFGGVSQQLRYVQTDGSTSASGTLPSVNKVTDVAATDDDRMPLVAHSQEDGIVRLPPGANWRTAVKKGSAPAYPG